MDEFDVEMLILLLLRNGIGNVLGMIEVIERGCKAVRAKNRG